jgi:signal transduction histidine kinase
LQDGGLERFLETLARHAVEIAGASAGWFFLPSADETRFDIVGPVKRDLHRGVVPVLSVPRALPLDGVARDVCSAVKAARDFYWNRLDPRPVPPALLWGMKGQQRALRLPIRFGATVVGHLSLIFAPKASPSELGQFVARVLGQQAGLAIGMQRQQDDASRSAIEAERGRMAGEVHDGVAQSFLGVLMQARAARQTPSPSHATLARCA